LRSSSRKRSLTSEIRQGMAMPTDRNVKTKGDMGDGTDT